MQRIVAKTLSFFKGIPGYIYLWLAIIIFGASNAITRRLTEIGSQNFVDGRNPISFCNVLFVGNICALLILILIYHQQWNIRSLRQLSWKDWLSLIAVAILSGALAPGLIFEALSQTMVTNVVLIGRIEPPLVLALSVWFLKERVNFLQIAGAIVSLAGVILIMLLQRSSGENMMNMGGFISVGTGEIFAAAGAVALAVSTIISKFRIEEIPLGIYTVFRTALGSVIFFFAALYFYGSNHFMDVFSPFLWQWMLVYGAVIVAVGQSSWFTGLKSTTASKVSLASSFTPVVAIVAAYLILGEVPTLAQCIGGSVILGGILLSQIGVRRKSHRQEEMAHTSSNSKEMDMRVGFKGI
ncbi:DMT family transporter [Coleofasciculus sp. H7-2]|uniref:DMT family transporter n=1 Tax=Coleofasciculus sp. H7-2 TaxID=3351545 RepID=UPI00366F2128